MHNTFFQKLAILRLLLEVRVVFIFPIHSCCQNILNKIKFLRDEGFYINICETNTIELNIFRTQLMDKIN